MSNEPVDHKSTNDVPNITWREFGWWLFRRRYRFRVIGNSMQPLFKPGDEVLIDPLAYRKRLPIVGDVVVAQHPFRPNLRLIKRVQAVLASGDCFLIGDHAIASTDSRSFGAIPYQTLLGRVTSRF